MPAAKAIVCPSCGFQKNPPGSARCASCGAKIEDLARSKRARDEDVGRRYQQEGVSVQWLVIAFLVQGVLTAALVFGLPMVLPMLDFEGQNGMLMCIPVWFLGGLLVAIPTTFLLIQSQTVRTMPLFLYLIFAGIGILLTLIGAYMGERIQLGPPPKTAE